MGDIIRLPARPAAYPATSATLDRAETVLLTAIRHWVQAYRQDEDPVPRLAQELEIAGAPDAALPIDAVMMVLARSVRQPVSIHCPRCRGLSDEEKHLLYAASVVQAGDVDLAERTLRNVLLTAEGAAWALGPLQELGEMFAEAGLFLRRRTAPGGEDSNTWAAPWRPDDVPQTIH